MQAAIQAIGGSPDSSTMTELVSQRLNQLNPESLSACTSCIDIVTPQQAGFTLNKLAGAIQSINADIASNNPSNNSPNR
jgi:hypothetical protein